MFLLLLIGWVAASTALAVGVWWAVFEYDRIVRVALPIWRSPRVRRLATAGLFLWFAYWAWHSVGGTFSEWPNHLDTVGVDGRLYYRAASTWVAGGDPWTAYTTTNTWPVSGAYIHFLFTGPPPTVLAFVPFVWIPESAFVIGWFALTVGAAIYTLRRLGLPLWWLLFPPMATGILVANPHVVALALLLSSSHWLQALASPIKAYALIPLVGERRWRALGILGVTGAVSLVAFWPLWSSYISEYPAISSWLAGATHGGFSAARDPALLAVAIVLLAALALIDRREAGWLAVPTIWPATQGFYATFVLPLQWPWLAAALAMSNRAAFPTMSQVLVAALLIRVARLAYDRAHAWFAARALGRDRESAAPEAPPLS
jgi:hypothetical protein